MEKKKKEKYEPNEEGDGKTRRYPAWHTFYNLLSPAEILKDVLDGRLKHLAETSLLYKSRHNVNMTFCFLDFEQRVFKTRGQGYQWTVESLDEF